MHKHMKTHKQAQNTELSNRLQAQARIIHLLTMTKRYYCIRKWLQHWRFSSQFDVLKKKKKI